MKLIVYNASKDDAPQRSIEFIRCYHGSCLGVHVRWGMRRYHWLWRLCR